MTVSLLNRNETCYDLVSQQDFSGTLCGLRVRDRLLLKTSQFKTQCKGDISHAFKTAKIILFNPDVPLQDELLC